MWFRREEAKDEPSHRPKVVLDEEFGVHYSPLLQVGSSPILARLIWPLSGWQMSC